MYQLGVVLASHFNEKVKKMWKGERNSFLVLDEKADPDSEYLWFHAASLGEFEQARPIIERIKHDTPEEKILLTFFSPSGYEVRKDYEYADIVCYLPLDTPTNVLRFTRRIKIKTAYFIKYEFWWNYMHMLHKRHIPVYSVSSIFRKNQIFFKWYGYPYNLVLKCISHFFVQNEISKQLLATLGITNVTITGDTRFDRVKQIQEQAKVLTVVEDFIAAPSAADANSKEAATDLPKSPKVFIPGSSWPPDVDIFFRYFAEHPEWKLIIAPHVIGNDHLQEIESKLQKYGMTSVYYKDLESKKAVDANKQTDQKQATDAKREVLIINCFGLLSSIYRYGDVTYVGGGFGVGIHNVLEAAVWGVPVFFGPNNERFQEAQDLKASGGGIEIKSYDDFAQKMDALNASDEQIKAKGKAAKDYVASKCGATDKVLSMCHKNKR